MNIVIFGLSDIRIDKNNVDDLIVELENKGIHNPKVIALEAVNAPRDNKSREIMQGVRVKRYFSCDDIRIDIEN